MDQNLEFAIKMTLTFVLSGLIFLVMMRIQKQREKAAEIKYRQTLKARGINPDLEEK